MATESTRTAETDEISLKELIESIQAWVLYIFSRWRLIVIMCVLGGTIGLGYSLLTPPLFTATTTFVLESKDNGRGNLGRLSGLAAVAGVNLGGDAGGLFQEGNIYELYKSRTMLAQTLLEKVHPDSGELLIERYIKYNDIRSDWKDRPELLALDFSIDPNTLDAYNQRLYEGVITSFTDAIRSDVLTVDKFDKNLSIVRVDVSSPDEVFSKVFNEALVKKVNEFYVETKTKKYTENIAIMERKVDSVHAAMTGAIYSAAKASDATPNLNPTRQVQRIAPTQEAQFSAEVNRTMLTQLLQNLEMTKVSLLQEQPLLQLVDGPVYPLPIERVGKVKGVVLGAFIFGFLAVLSIFLMKVYRDIVNAEK